MKALVEMCFPLEGRPSPDGFQFLSVVGRWWWCSPEEAAYRFIRGQL